MGCLEGSGVPVLYIGRTVTKDYPLNAGIKNLRATLPDEIFNRGI
jgi:hypothetical protein